MTTERIDIIVREDGSREVRRNLEDIGASAQRGAGGVDRLHGAMSQLKLLLASMGIGAGIAELLRYTDTWASLTGRLSLVTQSYAQLKQVQTEVFNIAQRTRSQLEGTADLYGKITRSTEALNKSDTQRLRVTESINKATIISGASSSSAAAALMQLGQAFGANRLGGEELNSVLEQTPRLAQAIAEGMGRTVGELKGLAGQGKLTADVVFKALESQAATLDAEFAKMPQTIAQSFTLLQNEVIKFVGSGAEANGVASNFAAVLSLVARNLDVIGAALQGLVVYKLADWFLNSAAAAVRKYLAIVDASNALIAERAASIAAAEAAIAHAGAELAVATATQAAILTSREEQVARLAQANANIAAARSAMAAAEAAGAQSFALYTLRNATAQLAVAEGERAAAIAALATLGQQQARVSAQIAVATAAEAAATTALAGARSAAVGAAGLAGRALGLLGGPIGLITTVLTLGATAWSLWGNKASESEKQASGAVEQSHEQIMGKLDEQIKKLQERNKLLQLNPELAKPDGNAAVTGAKEDQAKLLDQIAQTGKRTDISLEARTEIMRVLGAQYAEATAKVASFNKEQDLQDKIVNGDKVKSFLNKHEEYLSKTEQLAKALADARKELGVDVLPKDIEKRITDSLGKKDNQHDSLLQYKATIEELKMQQKLEKEIADGRLAAARAQYDQGNLSQTGYLEAQRNAQLEENQRNIEFVQRELEVTKGAGKEQVAARQQYIGELRVLAQQRLNIEQGYNDSVAGIFTARNRAEIDAGNAEITAINGRNKQLEDQITYFNMLPDAITRATIAELENQKAVLQGDFADEAKVTAIDGKIEALKRLANAQTASQRQAFDYDQSQQFAQAWQQTGEIIGNALTSAFSKGGQAMGKLVQSYAGLKSQESSLKKQYDDRVKVAAGDAKRISDAQIEYANQSAIAEAGAYADMAGAAKGYFGEKTAAYKVLNGIEQAYRLQQIALAAEEMARKIFFTTAVTSAKVTGIATETAAATASVAPTLAADAAKGASAAAVGVATQAQGDPYTAWGRMAAMAAVMTALGFAVSSGGGGPSLSAQRQQSQGTGSVLGDADKKSDSIAKALEHVSSNSDVALKHSSSMVASLHNIESSISGLSSLLVRTTDIANPDVGNLNSNNGLGKTITSLALGGVAGALLSKIPAIGNLLGKIGTSIFGGKQSVEDSGFTLDKGSIAQLLASGVNASRYAEIKTSGGWFSSDKYNTQTSGLGAEANDQFTKVIQSMVQSISAAGTALGDNCTDFTTKLDGFVVDIGKISLKGLTGEEIEKQLQAVFSKLGDDMARYALGGLDEFQKVGEGYFETLVRVAGGVDSANYELEKLGVTAVKYTNIVNKQGDVETEIIRQSLLAVESGKGVADMLSNFSGSAEDLVSTYKDLLKVRQLFNNTGLKGNNLSADTIRGAGGLDELNSGAQKFFDDFFTDAEKHAAQLANLTTEFAKLGQSVPGSKQAFHDLVLEMDDGTEKGNKLVGQLLALSGAVSDLYSDTKDAQDLLNSRRALEIRLLELSGRKAEALAESRKDELASMDASLRDMQKQVYALEDLADARDALNQAYEDEKSRLEGVRDKFKELGNSLREFAQQLNTGDLSVLDPEAKYQAAKDNFNKVYGLAKGGDADAMAQLQQASQDFLGASKDYFATSSQYTQDFALVQQALGQSASAADAQANIAQAQLTKMSDMVTGITDVRTTTQKFLDAFQAYVDAKQAVIKSGASLPVTPGSSAGSSPLPATPEAVQAYGNLYGNDAYYFTPGINDYEAKLKTAHMFGELQPDGMTDEQRLGVLFGHDAKYWKDASDQFYAGQHPVARALGGYTGAGLVKVGEYGPELVNFDRPGMVYTAGQTASMLGGNDVAELIDAMEAKLDAVVIELKAANVQRGVATTAMMEKLGEVKDSNDDLARAVERNS